MALATHEHTYTLHTLCLNKERCVTDGNNSVYKYYFQ